MSTIHPGATGRRYASAELGGAFTVDGFCSAHGISRSLLYRLWRTGEGPRFRQIANKRIISAEAAAEYGLAPRV